jgi:hypothetical protein
MPAAKGLKTARWYCIITACVLNDLKIELFFQVSSRDDTFLSLYMKRFKICSTGGLWEKNFPAGGLTLEKRFLPFYKRRQKPSTANLNLKGGKHYERRMV